MDTPDQTGAAAGASAAYDALKSQQDKDAAIRERLHNAVQAWPAGYRMFSDGFFKDVKDADGETVTWRLCDPFVIIGEISNISNAGTGILIGFKTSRGREKLLLVPLSEVHGQGLGKYLADAGLRCDPSKIAMDHLRKFFATIRPKVVITSVSAAGWHELDGRLIYLRPDNTAFGAPPVSVFGQVRAVMLRRGDSIEPPVSDLETYGSSGWLEDWQIHIGLLAISNSRLAFMIAAGFVAPLMGPTGASAGGVHLCTETSKGKTASLAASASIWGKCIDTKGKATGVISTWRATSNSMELLATANNDAPLYLDEIAEMSVRELRQIIYSLINGSGKRRMTASGGARDTHRWATFPISTGEKAVPEILEEDGQSVPGGIEVRLISVPGDAGKGLGTLDHHEGSPTPGEFVNRLLRAALRFYGTAGPTFLEKLVTFLNGGEENRAKLKAWMRNKQDAFLQQVLGGVDASGQVTRAAGTFALVAAAGELATSMGILPWPEGEATRAATICFNAWLDARGHLGTSDDQRSITEIRRAVALYGDSRFYPLYQPSKDDKSKPEKDTGFTAEPPPGTLPALASAPPEDDTGVTSMGSNQHVRWGYWRTKRGSEERQFLFYVDVWRRELKISTSRKSLIALMIEKGYLDPGNGSNDGTRGIKVDGKTQRFFVVNASILG